MVFESIVADLLNRFLGDFVDNLDSSQLNIGIWGGDVKLENLEIKESALDDFDLPVKLKYGYLSSLVLKIPWKNLYNEPVIATIDDLNIIAVPNKGVVYNEEKAKKNAADIKQKTLARLEEARKNRRKPADPQADSFAEKMITQIIKNLQVSISNIHVRYEDKYTNRHRPFVAGVTLQKLDFQTTDDNWIPTIHKEVVKIIHKLVLLDNLAIYWNSEAKLISDLTDKAEIKRKLQESIHAGKNKPIGYKYILEPIKMAAKLKLNQKPETDGTNWKTPKIDLEVDMQAIALAIGKLQYQDVLLFLEAQERFGLAAQYLRYRPHLNEYKGKYKEWWHFAYKSILEEKVRRRRNNWSWKRMKSHRDLVRKYRDAWVIHQTEKSPSAALSQIIKDAEENLDVFNVNVARQQAEMEIDRKGLTRLEDQPQGWVAWGKSWFGGSGAGPKPAEKKTNGKDYASQFQEAMTPEEKAKLFEAIDYQENIPPTNYPKEFVENRFDFRLNQVAIVVDGAVSMQLLHLKAHVEQRPSAGAKNLQSSVQELRMDGCGAEMLRVRDPSRMWLAFVLDTKPLSGAYDQKVQLSISPVNLKYHAPAVNNAIDVFKPPESVKLNQLTALAMSRYEEVKTRSVTGLAHAFENKSKLVLDINIEPATLMISHGGIYVPEKPTILADLGLLSIKTVDSSPIKSGTDKMYSLQEQAYDKFHVKLSNVVVTMAENFEKARSSLGVKESPLHILKPTGLDIEIHKSSIDDLKLPKMKILGNLPDIVVGISDKRLLMLLRLLSSIPKPEAEPEIIIEDLAPVKAEGKLKDRAKMKTIMEVEEIDEASLEKTGTKNNEDEKEKKSTTSEQQVQIELDLHLNQIGFVLLKDEEAQMTKTSQSEADVEESKIIFNSGHAGFCLLSAHRMLMAATLFSIFGQVEAVPYFVNKICHFAFLTGGECDIFEKLFWIRFVGIIMGHLSPLIIFFFPILVCHKVTGILYSVHNKITDGDTVFLWLIYQLAMCSLFLNVYNSIDILSVDKDVATAGAFATCWVNVQCLYLPCCLTVLIIQWTNEQQQKILFIYHSVVYVMFWSLQYVLRGGDINILVEKRFTLFVYIFQYVSYWFVVCRSEKVRQSSLLVLKNGLASLNEELVSSALYELAGVGYLTDELDSIFYCTKFEIDELVTKVATSVNMVKEEQSFVKIVHKKLEQMSMLGPEYLSQFVNELNHIIRKRSPLRHSSLVCSIAGAKMDLVKAKANGKILLVSSAQYVIAKVYEVEIEDATKGKLQVASSPYCGKWIRTIGTNVILETDNGELKVVAVTDKMLKTEKALLTSPSNSNTQTK